MKTVAMCGSMRFADQMRAIAFELETAQGMCVLTCVEPVSAELSQAERAALGRAHLHKIELADAESGGVSVVHFADGSEAGDVIENVNAEGEAIRFVAQGFDTLTVPLGTLDTTLHHDGKPVRVLHSRHTRIVYHATDTEVTILLLWDNRRNEDDMQGLLSER